MEIYSLENKIKFSTFVQNKYDEKDNRLRRK